METYQGVTIADTCEVRFAFSGKISSIKKRTGDNINKGELLASLDRKELQTELDRVLKQYEKVRAEFEIFKQKLPSDPDDLTKYQTDAKQAELDRSVKDVELAKMNLDQVDLMSPVSGTIVDMEGLREGLYITPGGSPIKIIDRDSIRFSFTPPQDHFGEFTSGRRVKIKFPGIGKEYFGNTIPPIYALEGQLTILVNLEESGGLIRGLRGEISGS